MFGTAVVGATRWRDYPTGVLGTAVVGATRWGRWRDFTAVEIWSAVVRAAGRPGRIHRTTILLRRTVIGRALRNRLGHRRTRRSRGGDRWFGRRGRLRRLRSGITCPAGAEHHNRPDHQPATRKPHRLVSLPTARDLARPGRFTGYEHRPVARLPIDSGAAMTGLLGGHTLPVGAHPGLDSAAAGGTPAAAAGGIEKDCAADRFRTGLQFCRGVGGQGGDGLADQPGHGLGNRFRRGEAQGSVGGVIRDAAIRSAGRCPTAVRRGRSRAGRRRFPAGSARARRPGS